MFLNKYFYNFAKKFNFTDYFYTNYLNLYKISVNNSYTILFVNYFNYDNTLPQNTLDLKEIVYKLHFILNIRFIYIYIYKLILDLKLSFVNNSSINLFYLAKFQQKQDYFLVSKNILPVLLFLIDKSTLI
jgi:hypothetical protein